MHFKGFLLILIQLIIYSSNSALRKQNWVNIEYNKGRAAIQTAQCLHFPSRQHLSIVGLGISQRARADLCHYLWRCSDKPFFTGNTHTLTKAVIIWIYTASSAIASSVPTLPFGKISSHTMCL